MSRTSSRNRRQVEASQEEEEEEEEDEIMMNLTLTQQCEPEKSQSFPQAKANERHNLESMTEDQRTQVICDTSRLVLFKGLAGDEPIDRLKCIKQVPSMVNSNARITSAVWNEVQTNLRNVFGFELVKPPQYMMTGLPKKYDDRFFLKNAIVDDEAGEHSKAIHSIHPDASLEKGLLMVVLAFVFCKGGPRPGSPSSMRWISDIDLYRLLHGLDETLPKDPPKQRSSTSSRMTTTANGTPKADVLLEKFCSMDYLIKDKDKDTDDLFLYTMGPRAALEVGRRQVIYFCSEILGEQPDPTMLQELEDEEATQTMTTQ